MGKKIFLDTNILLDKGNNIEELGYFYVSSVTLRELEHIKTSRNKDDEVKAKARQVTRWLADNKDKYDCIVVTQEHYNYLNCLGLDLGNDNLIMACARLLDNVVFHTNDICCLNVARKIFGLETVSNRDNKDVEYKGYCEIDGDTDSINSLFEQYGNGDNPLDLCENQYLIIHNKDLNNTHEYRYCNKELKNIKLPSSKVIKALNEKQRCALDLLLDKSIPIKFICGNYGSGKTLLSVKMALYHVLEKGNFSKMTFFRNPVGAGESVGYLKGTKEDKLEGFFKPIVQHLDGGEFQLQNLVQRGQIEMEIPFYAKGLSIGDSFIVVDECEDLDIKTIKLLGTRVEGESNIVFCGDWKQAENKYIHNNGLIHCVDKLKGNPLVGIVVLDEDVRSNASKVFAMLD